MKNTPIYSVDIEVDATSTERIDQYIAAHLPGCTRTKAQALIIAGAVHINNQPNTKSNKTVRKGDVITIFITDTAERNPETGHNAQFFAENIIFEHEHFLVINKPAGITVHAPSLHSTETTVADLITAYDPRIKTVGEPSRPGIVHRLDKLTSGLLLIAKTSVGYDALRTLFSERLIKKHYLAIVSGRPPKTGSIRCPIIRDPFDPRRMACADNVGRKALTTYTVITYYDTCALIQAEPFTGRTHQIRVHMAHAGFPILGDPIYGKAHKDLNRYALHAGSLAFSFMGKEFNFNAPLPTELVDFLKKCNPADENNPCNPKE